jgi:hypothetical protein
MNNESFSDRYKLLDELVKNNIEFTIECSSDSDIPDKLFIKDFEFIWTGKQWFNKTDKYLKSILSPMLKEK